MDTIDVWKKALGNLLGEMTELSQPRSNFVLDHFVVGAHDRPARQRQQVLLELREIMFSLADLQDSINLDHLDIAQFEQEREAVTDHIQFARLEIMIGKKQREIEALNMQVTGKLRECEYLYAMLDRIPPVTQKDLEREEQEYWAARLTRQFTLAQRDAGGNLTAILDMMTEPGKQKPELAVRLDQAIAAIGLSDKAVQAMLEAE